eukprot:TRINITY_DN475_c0_g1_i1.p1 TRINITY_DN475_c0_g1~~TRINITY_DN475_c0_g1_i1.p1  ORF type:complete len:488 (+),score=87.50 TRINITY_DN475_c0_g1_i1:101-1564(+)
MADDDITAESVRKNWKTLTDAQLALAISSPNTSAEILKVVSQMDERQIKIVFPLMSGEQIKRVIPQMQLEKQGAAVSVMNANQVRDCVSAIPKGDRQLLLQNITLITQSSQPLNELQSFITFIDPLAMAVAVEKPELVDKVIQVTSIMTPGQIRVMVPLMTLDQIRRTIENIVESEECLNVALEMLGAEQKEEFCKIFDKEFSEYDSKLKQLQEDGEKVCTNLMPFLHKDIELFCSECTIYSTEVEQKYRKVTEQVTVVRSQIETLQKAIRNVQHRIKLPLIIITKQENDRLYSQYLVLSENYITLSRQMHSQFLRLTTNNSDGLIQLLNHRWLSLQSPSKTESKESPSTNSSVNNNNSNAKESTDSTVPAETTTNNSTSNTTESSTVTRSSSPSENTKSIFDVSSCNEEELVFVDEDSSVELYEAIKAIGNPNTFGDIYKISWEDIIKCGFRRQRDFAEKNINNLKELETFISNHNAPSPQTDSTK